MSFYLQRPSSYFLLLCPFGLDITSYITHPLPVFEVTASFIGV